MEFSMNLTSAAAVISQLESEKKRLNQYQSSVQAVISKCPLSGSTKTAVCSSLRTVSGAIAAESVSMQSMAGGLEQIIAAYRATETKLAGVQAGSTAGSEGTGSGTLTGTVEAAEESDNSFDWSLIWKLVGKGGIIGSGLAAIGSLITGGVSVKNVLSSLKYGTDMVGAIAKAVPESFDFKSLFGLNAAVKTSTPTSWLGQDGTLAREISKLNFSNAQTASEKVACGAKWAGYTLTAVTTTYDNFTDPDNTTFARRLAESVGETAVKIGEGILISSAITAGLAAIGLVGAPALVVGGATVLAVVGLDAISTAVTGKDLAEFVSDTVIDGAISAAKGVSNAVQSAGQAVGDAAKAAGNAISGWWSSVTSSASRSLSFSW